MRSQLPVNTSKKKTANVIVGNSIEVRYAPDVS